MLRGPSKSSLTVALLLAGWLLLSLRSANSQSAVNSAAANSPTESLRVNLPEFEVATIKPVTPGGMHMTGIHVYPGGRVTIQSVSLKSLIVTAFDMSYWQISGGESMEKQLYDIEAKPPEAVASRPYNLRYSSYHIEDERLRQMLQALLIDRFHLEFHQPTKVSTVYLLELSGKTIPLLPFQSIPGSESPYHSGDIGAAGGTGWSLHDTSMPQLASFLSDYVLHQKVIDRTGLQGSFDFQSRYTMTNDDFKNPDFMSTFMPVVKEMGFKLESTKGSVETFVIDRAEPPTAN